MSMVPGCAAELGKDARERTGPASFEVVFGTDGNREGRKVGGPVMHKAAPVRRWTVDGVGPASAIGAQGSGVEGADGVLGKRAPPRKRAGSRMAGTRQGRRSGPRWGIDRGEVPAARVSRGRGVDGVEGEVPDARGDANNVCFEYGGGRLHQE